MATHNNKSNVLPFRREAGNKAAPKKRADFRHSPIAPQFPHHDRVVRLNLRGLVHNDGFIRWLVEEAMHLQLDGWARTGGEGEMDILLAGEVGDVRQMIEFLKVGPRPIDMLLVDERALSGDEPLWSGFHHLSPK